VNSNVLVFLLFVVRIRRLENATRRSLECSYTWFDSLEWE